MILYYRPTCPYCVKVLNYVKEKNIALELRDI
ncbi:glutathione S-transferase N-terminal domain-containing protein, partial [Candidatus Kaiserbacteria bacterium]|nr:glutathione S-transferase N-terminal domain-containing protein [Candidatus Kaiserbacteria bacterium]